MNKAFEKILERLDEMIHPKQLHFCKCARGRCRLFYNNKNCMDCVVKDAKEIVQEVAEEYNNGWIACNDRLPEEPFGCLVTVMDCEPSTQTDFENILPYFVGYDGHSWNDEDGREIPFEVIAWIPLPEPYQPKGE